MRRSSEGTPMRGAKKTVARVPFCHSTRRPMRHMVVTVFVFFDLTSGVALTAQEPRSTETKRVTHE